MARPSRPVNRTKRPATPMATPVAAGPVAASSVAAPKRPFNPGRFAKEVRAEARKITWTSRKETWITSVMVFIMVVLTAIFFFLADLILSWSINMILKLAS